MFHVEQRGQWVRVWRGRDGGGWLCRTLLESTDLQAMQQGVGVGVVSAPWPPVGRAVACWGVSATEPQAIRVLSKAPPD